MNAPKPRGGQCKPDDQKRVAICIRLLPRHLAWLKAKPESAGFSISQLIEKAMKKK